MSIKDVIKSKVYESLGAGANLTLYDICIILVISCLVGAYIFFVYKNFSKSAFYSKDLNIALAGMTIMVAAIMVAMQSNLLVSLGMVGALSIVRFRTAIKNPLDLLYLFWSISEGIICGVNLYALGAVLCIIMTLLLLILGKVPNAKASALIIIKAQLKADTDSIEKSIKEKSKYLKQSSVIVHNGEREIIYEIISTRQNEIIDTLSATDGVLSVNWLEHSGELRA